jgi:hypothetical protein
MSAFASFRASETWDGGIRKMSGLPLMQLFFLVGSHANALLSQPVQTPATCGDIVLLGRREDGAASTCPVI